MIIDDIVLEEEDLDNWLDEVPETGTDSDLWVTEEQFLDDLERARDMNEVLR